MNFEIQENFEKLKTAVFERRPALKEILAHYGTHSTFDYIKSTIGKPVVPSNLERQAQLIEVVKAETSARLGEQVAEDVAAQLKKYYCVSTTDHFGPMYHPWVFNFNLVASAVFSQDSDPDLKNIITLACSNVSLNNFSFPRGFAFHNDITGKSLLSRFSFLPSNAHSYPVYGFRSYLSEEVKKVKNLIKENFAKKQISQFSFDKVNDILDTVYGTKDILDLKYYADQVTKTNFALWKKIVPETPKKINFVYLEQEWIVVKLLIKYHLSEKTTISRIIFDNNSEELLMKYFSGLPESFSRRDHLGTYLFWAQPKSFNCPHRLRLWKEGNFLVSEEGTYRIELTPEALAQALENKELIPSVLLTFMVLCFYYGLTCLGGLGQINYLPKLKEAYIKMQADLGHVESVAACSLVEAKILGGEITVALAESVSNGTVPATSFDFLIYGNEKAWDTLVEESKIITMEEAIVPMFNEDYQMTYSLEERDPNLAAITSKDITKLMDLDSKIKACVSISK